MRGLVLALLLATASPVLAYEADEYSLDELATISLGDRWWLMKFGVVILEPWEEDTFQLFLDSCPGGVDGSPDLYVAPRVPAPFSWHKVWFHPLVYNGYIPDTWVYVRNDSPDTMAVRLKLTVRCKE